MDDYKKKLKIRIALLSIPAIIAVSLGVFDVFWAMAEMKNSFIFGFQSGAASALGVLSLYLIMKYRQILCDEQKMKMQFNKENDERLKAIRAKAGLPLILITSVTMIIVGVIGGYFNLVVFYSLTAALCQLTIAIIVKRVYMKKM